MTALPLGRARIDAALWAALIGQTEVGVAVCDADGLLIEMNATLEAMLGEPYHPTSAAQWTRLYHLCEEDGSPLSPDDTPLLQTLRGKAVIDRVITTRPADGPVRHLRCNGARLYDRRGRDVGAVVFVADVTGSVEQQRRLESLRCQLVDVVNHELRTPAAVIKGHLELLEDLWGEMPDRATAHLEPILRAMERLEEVLDTIRQLTDHTSSSPGQPDTTR